MARIASRPAAVALAASMVTVLLIPSGAAAGNPRGSSTVPSGERTFGQVTIEPAYDDMTGQPVYLLTPNHLAPLGTTNVIDTVSQKAAAPLYIVVYPATETTSGWTFNCAGVPGNCPDHGLAIAGIATSTSPSVYGGDPYAVPGHDHLVGVASTGGDFNVPWHVYVEVFTSAAAVTHITTLSELGAAKTSGAITEVDTGITFACAVVSQATYELATPVS